MRESSPLEDLYMDYNDVSEEAVRDALEGLIAIDTDSGKPIYLSGYFDLDNRPRFIAQLLSRKATVLLGEREESEEGAQSGIFAEQLESSASSVQNYASELEFVQSDKSRGGYVIRLHHVQDAVNRLNEAKGASEE